MEYLAKQKLHLIAENAYKVNKYRTQFHNIYMDPKGFAVVSDSHTLVAVSFDDLKDTFNADFSPLTGKYIEPKVWKELCSPKTTILSIADNHIKTDKATYNTISEVESTFPEWLNVVPTVEIDKDNPTTFSFNTKLMRLLSEALGTDFLHFYNPNEKNSEHRAFTTRVKNSIGLLMPIISDKESLTKINEFMLRLK
jgi:hypothetical protein